MTYTRRDFGRLAVIGAPALLLAAKTGRAASAAVKPDSTWAGVQVGLNVPYSLGTRTAMTAEEILTRCVALGVSHVELRAQAIENSFGLPSTLVLGPAISDYIGARAQVGDVPGVSQPPPPPATTGTTGTAGGRMPRTPEEIAAYKATAKELGQWRLAVPMAKAKELRAKYAAAGVNIGIVKFDGLSDLEGAELDYAFTLAKALGARGISGELVMPAAERLGQAADRHQLFVAHHAHLAGSPKIYENAMSYGKFAGMNLDIGHFVAGNYGSPLPFIEKHHAKITHLHIKDRKKNGGPNVAFGEGDTPVKEVLQALRDRRWPIQAIIEFEIPLPAGTDRAPEIMKAIDYCKRCLVG